MDTHRTTIQARLAAVLLAALALTGCGGGAGPKNTAADEAAIRKSLDEIARAFNSGDYDSMFAQYMDDVLVSAPGQPEIVGKAAWRAGLANLPPNLNIRMRFDTQELVVSGDLAYERGTFTMDMADKASGAQVASVTNRHEHIFKRQPDGRWLGWRLMENSATAPAPVPPAAPATPATK